MKVSGRATVDAPREAVFAAICDPAALLEVIPGCREIHLVAENEYHGRIVMRLPAVVGSYETVVKLVDTDPPAYGALEGSASGRMGSVAGGGSFRLSDDEGRTVIEYQGTGVISGPLARLDSRFIEGVARSLINEGLARLGHRLQQAQLVAAG